ncbi:tyrosine-protein phosphatase [Erysipelothrix urinaevulpis]|uniref:tyrosine-protein phosphatase n=1 Tax=Erysipelothrix urinaevulpis TaxID=2683717 RepID=UPI00135A4D89|nr:tyrosine-protein phosphatase [Erysipelothrix urinaevulpis]
MSELINFRDFGGIETKEGKKIKEGIFFRSGSYRDLLEEDREYIKSLGIQNLFDYRETNELDKDEKREELTQNFHEISASAHLGTFEQNTDDEFITIDDASMIEFYQRLPMGNPAYKNLFKTLLEDDAVPMLHNCTAGKDRTGIATALIQLSLGVDYDAILLDYLKSMDAYEYILQNERRRLNGHAEETLMHKLSGLVVKPAFLKAALDAVLEEYETVENYLEQEFDLNEENITKLRLKYTE